MQFTSRESRRANDMTTETVISFPQPARNQLHLRAELRGMAIEPTLTYELEATVCITLEPLRYRKNVSGARGTLDRLEHGLKGD